MALLGGSEHATPDRGLRDVLGPLSNIIEEDQKRRELKGRKITRKASVQHKGKQIADLESSSHFDFSMKGTFFIDQGNLCDVSITRHARGKEFNMRRFNKCQVKARGLEASVIRAKEIMSNRRVASRFIQDLLAGGLQLHCSAWRWPTKPAFVVLEQLPLCGTRGTCHLPQEKCLEHQQPL